MYSTSTSAIEFYGIYGYDILIIVLSAYIVYKFLTYKL